MTTNSKPWQAIVNPNHLSEAINTGNNLSVAQKEKSVVNQVNTYAKKLVTPKRYSIDDNGGGYQGL